MPGITGIISSSCYKKNKSSLESMVNSMMHETSYSVGSYIDEQMGVYIGWVCHKGSSVDCMPIWNETRDKCLIFYGEDFSDGAIVDSLKRNGHKFTSGDASYLIHLFEEKADNFFSCLNGFFNGVLINVQRKEITMFNDRYGMQRIYYYERDDGFFFSSEAKALLNICPELREFVPASLGQLFSMGCILENKTLFRNMYLLPGASLWKFANGKCQAKERYFEPATWERQSSLSKDMFYSELKDTFIKILPRYLNDSRPVGISLTGGLDTRMIMAHARFHPDTLPCYTFGSMYRDSFDVKVARKVAAICNQKHFTIRVGKEFLSLFPRLAEKAIYITDGCLEAIDATELYVNQQAKAIAPIRVTGNYGSEVLRSIRAFKPKPPNRNLFHPDFLSYIDGAGEIYKSNIERHSLSFTAFKQAPLYNFNRLSLEQSQLTMRTPFMDNDLVKIVYRAPNDAVESDELSLRLVEDGNARLWKIITNRGVGGNSYQLFSKSRQMYHEIVRLGEMFFDYGMPQWYSHINHYLTPLHMERLFLGKHKFHHFRIWFQNELAHSMKEILLDSSTLNRPYLNSKFIQQMVTDHIKGDKNYTTEINKIITYEFINRLFA